MKKIMLGDYCASQIALGCMRIGNLSEKAAHKHIKAAYDAGINFFDNADIYCNGVSEEYFGGAIKGIDRESIIIQTKCGIRQGFYDFSKEHIISSVEGSLKRMGIDYIDILCLHRPDILMNPEEVAQAFCELKERGLVKGFGVSNFNSMQIELLKKYIDVPIVANQLQLGLFHTGMIDSGMCVNMENSLSIDRDGSVLPYCRVNGIVVQAWGPMRSKNGFFTDDEELKAENAILEEYAGQLGVTKEALAIAWLMRMNFVQPIIGTTSSERLLQMIKADGIELTRRQWYSIYKDMGNVIP